MSAVQAVEFRAAETVGAVLTQLLKEMDADNAMTVNCADPRVEFVVQGWFVFPKGSLSKTWAVKHGS